jgi:hypothetical protein
MIDVVTKKPLRVLTAGNDALPYVHLAFEQLDELRRVLDAHGVRYRVPVNAISFDGGPEMVIVHLFPNGGVDAPMIQAMLDNAR